MVEWLAGNRLRGTTAERPSVSLQSPSVGGWVEVGRFTASGTVSSMPVTSLPDKRYYMYLSHYTTNADGQRIEMNSDTGSNYSWRYSNNGGSDSTSTSQTNILGGYGGSGLEEFNMGYIANKSNKEKLTQTWTNSYGGSGAGNAPNRREIVGKWANTSNAIDELDFPPASSTFQSGAEVVVLGWDPSDSHTTNFWEELASVELGSAENSLSTGTFTAKKYLWIQCYVPSSSGGADNYVIRVGNNTIDSGSNYSQRYNINGGAQGSGTQVNQDKIRLSFNISSGSEWFFANSFIINNSGNEKLLISHANRNSTTGAGTAPSRYEMVGKWANTSNQINIIDLLHQNSSSSLGAGTIIKVWGSD
jgi:hypothetical protein